jgi:hypothetical protein
MITGNVSEDGSAAKSGEILLLVDAALVDAELANAVLVNAMSEPTTMRSLRRERDINTPKII